MIISMAGFAVEDALIKKLSITMPISQVLVSVGLVGLFVLSGIAFITKSKLFKIETRKTTFFFRMFCELVSSILFVVTIVYVSLSLSSAILQATPIIIALGGSLFLKQSISNKQWILILIGLIGVLLVIQPGTKNFNSLAFLAVIGVFFLALRDLATRSISKSIPPISIAFWGFFSLTLGGFVCIPFFDTFQPYSMQSLWLIFVSAFFGPIAYLCLVHATRAGDVGIVAPFRYLRLPFALVLGHYFFDERVDSFMLIGSILIIISGVLIIFSTGKSLQSR